MDISSIIGILTAIVAALTALLPLLKQIILLFSPAE